MTAISSRRSILRLAAACPICLAAASLPPGLGRAEEKGHGWGYGGEGGPQHWGDLSSENKACSAGTEQSPIDLDGPVDADYPAVEVDFKPTPLKVVNNGHTIQVNCAAGSSSLIGGKRFQLLQFHFHHPSEHLLKGSATALECHFVHKSADGALGVLGVFIQPGTENAALAPLWAALPKTAGPEVTAPGTIDPAALLPGQRSFFRYMGSLTTPPCSEGVNWVVFDTPVEASEAQIKSFAALFAGNARPAQKLNRRFLLHAG